MSILSLKRPGFSLMHTWSISIYPGQSHIDGRFSDIECMVGRPSILCDDGTGPQGTSTDVDSYLKCLKLLIQISPPWSADAFSPRRGKHLEICRKNRIIAHRFSLQDSRLINLVLSENTVTSERDRNRFPTRSST